MSHAQRVVVIGAGIGGLTASLLLASRGFDVTVVEQARAPGGKLRVVNIAGQDQDAGPSVFTMRSVFEEIFALAGANLSDYVTLRPLEVLARHSWCDGTRLDLYADLARATEAIAEFAGRAEARRFGEFCLRARATYRTLDKPFMRTPKGSLWGLLQGSRTSELLRISPFVTLWRALGEHFHDPRLRQLFARYATYCGSSPFQSPATLMLVAHVEREGVWLVDGGMQRLAIAFAELAALRGTKFRYGEAARRIVVERGRISAVELANGERIDTPSVVINADVAAVAAGHFGLDVAAAVPATPIQARSLSAVTWNLRASISGFPLLRHTVFFSRDYAREFDEIFSKGRIPEEPTIYLCAQDRDESGVLSAPGDERLFCLINAPPHGERVATDMMEMSQCEKRAFSLLEQHGLVIKDMKSAPIRTTPEDFNRMFPATGGALYGRASHGWMASFRRPGARTSLRGLYLAGGSAHPGPGVPMATLSGQMAAQCLIADRDLV